MLILSRPPRTSDSVTFQVDPASGDITATNPASPHRIYWSATTGNAHIDEDRRVFGFHLSAHAFEVYAAEYYAATRVLELRACCGEGRGWVHHYGWTGDGRFADLPTPCPTCNEAA